MLHLIFNSFLVFTKLSNSSAHIIIVNYIIGSDLSIIASFQYQSVMVAFQCIPVTVSFHCLWPRSNTF